MDADESAREDLRKELEEKLDTYIGLAEMSKRAVERKRLQLEKYEGKIAVLREMLRKLYE